MGDSVKNQFNQLIKSVSSEVIEGEVLGQLKYMTSSLSDSSRKVKDGYEVIYRNNVELKQKMSNELNYVRKSMSELEQHFGVTHKSLEKLEGSVVQSINKIDQEISKGFNQSEEEINMLRNDIYTNQNQKLVDKLAFSNSIIKVLVGLNILSISVLFYLIWILTQYI